VSFFFFCGFKNEPSAASRGHLLALSSGMMLFSGFMALTDVSTTAGFAVSNFTFFAGTLSIGLIEWIQSHFTVMEWGLDLEAQRKRKVDDESNSIWTIMVVCELSFFECLLILVLQGISAIALHNFFLGVVIARMGVFLAIAIAIHNIPEGKSNSNMLKI